MEIIRCNTSKNKNKIERGFFPFPLLDFAREYVELQIIIVKLLCKLVSETTFTHEPADVLDGCHAVKAVDGHPAVRADFNNSCGVAYQLDSAVFKCPDISARVLVIAVQ